MATDPPSNVKIYDRPESKAPSPMLIVLGLMVALLLGYVVYRMFFTTPATPVPSASTTPSVSRFMPRLPAHGRVFGHAIRVPSGAEPV
ncbi:MAG: hypothetical protein SFU56_11300 [Capsulimonadales bacterium]|nr:hypothetical protein [Capsulimonadales bacterium]